MKLSVGKAWDEASAFLGREAKLVAPVALATFALPAVLVNWAYPKGMAGGAAGWLMLLVLVASFWGQMAIILLANRWPGSVGEALGTSARRIGVLIGAMALVFVPIILLFSIGLGVSLMGAGITDPAAVTPASLAKIPGFAPIILLLIIAFLFLGARLFVASAVAVMEKVGMVGLIKRSWSLARGAFLRLLALFVLLIVVQFILSIAATTVVGSIAALVAGEPKPFNTSALIVALSAGLVSALISTVWAAMAGRVYAQLAAPEVSVPSSS